MNILGLQLGRTPEQKRLDAELRSVKSDITTEARELWDVVQDVAPTLDVALEFVPDSKAHSGGWVKRSFNATGEGFSHSINAYANPTDHRRIRFFAVESNIENRIFRFELEIGIDSDLNKYYISTWNIGFSDEMTSSSKVSRERVFSLKGYGGILKSIVKQINLWHATSEVKEAAEFGVESKAVIEYARDQQST